MTKIREVAIADQATISRNQARMFFKMGKDRFRRRWQEYYRHRIRSVETRGGVRLLLTDVIAAAFPTASKTAVTRIAYEHLLYLGDKKAEEKYKELRAKVAAEDGARTNETF